MTTIPTRVFPFVLATPPSGKKPFTPLPIKQNSPQNNFLTPLQQDSVLFTGNNPGGLNDDEYHKYRSLYSNRTRSDQQQQEINAFAKRIHSARAVRNRAAAKRSRKTKLGRIAEIETLISPETAKAVKSRLKKTLEDTFPDVYKPKPARMMAYPNKKDKELYTERLAAKLSRNIEGLLLHLGKTLEKKGYTAKSPPTEAQVLKLVPGLFTTQNINSLGLRLPHKRNASSQDRSITSSIRSEEQPTPPPKKQRIDSVEIESEAQESPPYIEPTTTTSSPKPDKLDAAEYHEDDWLYQALVLPLLSKTNQD
jgi:hypothetical protein